MRVRVEDLWFRSRVRVWFRVGVGLVLGLGIDLE